MNHEPGTDTASHPEETSAPETLVRLVQRAEQAQASDIHLHARGPETTAFFRLDGVLTPVEQLPAALAERVFGRIKFLARLKTYQDSLPQDGRIDRQDLGSQSDIRVSTYPTVTGEKIVLRLFQSGASRQLAQLQFPADALAELLRFLAQTSGLLLISGPAGSGKTTTIYACLQQLTQTGSRNIITIEDPVEQVLPGVTQTEINEARGLDFAQAARHLLRQDPDVLVIGEVRDEATAAIALRAAFTGHLVISTLHAGSAKGVLDRFLDLSADPAAVANCLDLVLNQRLLRQTCPACSGKGCSACVNTGFRGRLPIVEFIRVTAEHKRRIRQQDLAQFAPVITLGHGAADLVSAGRTVPAEVARVLGV